MVTLQRKGSTSVVSFSSDLETLNYLEAYSQQTKMTRSTAIRYHIMMGRAYIQMLEEQKNEAANTAKNGSK